MIDDRRLMIEKKFAKSAIIDHRSKMLSASIQTWQEMLAKVAPVCVLRTGRRKVCDMPESKAPVCAAEVCDAARREAGR